ncbi:MAG TPA: hypothetical protein PKE40_04905 [Arachnia sp.]|nr:hypothetical protein [Arachnia sp.]HMT85672.1 hypothetical protein [Arachnia sp.]
MLVHVHPRVCARHPEISERDVQDAFVATLRKAPRIDTDPMQWVGVGLDSNGRMLEYVTIEMGPDEWLVYHAMPVTSKTLIEVGMKRR